MLAHRWTVPLLAVLSLIFTIAAYPSTHSPETIAVTETAKSPQNANGPNAADDDYIDEPPDEYVEKMADLFDLPLDPVDRPRRRKNLEYCKNVMCMPHYLCINDQIVTNGSELLESRLSLRINGDQTNIVCEDMEMPCCADEAMANLHQPESPIDDTNTPNGTVDKKNSNNNDNSYGNNENKNQNLHRCGYQSLAESNVAQMSTRILDGDESLPNEFPWMIGLFLHLDSDNLRFLGGGSLIHRSVILTAAHLLQTIPVDNLIVRAGDHNILDPLNDGKRQERNVSRKIIHNNLYVKSFINDIALLVVDRPFQLTTAVNTVCIPPQSVRNDDGQLCASCGWGKNAADRNGQYQATLKKVVLPIVSRTKCERTLRRTPLGPFYNLDESLMCAGGGRRDTCKGDGGSPLFCKIPQDDGRFYQTGIVAAGLRCGSDAPGLYVNVAHFSNWIKLQLGYINLKLDAENILSYDLFD